MSDEGYRLLVTGSRDWLDDGALWAILSAHVRDVEAPVTLISGACPTGADRMAEEWAAHEAHDIELHPADWERHGKRAGFLRNAEMVDSGADYCMAFIRKQSKGATMTRDLAQRKGIETFTVTVDD